MSGIAARLPDGRLHLQEGPIDLLIGAEGPADTVQRAHAAAIRAFDGLLAGLVAELPTLRRPADRTPAAVDGPVARRMVAAVRPHSDVFVTPMAAVAGAVADHILAAMIESAPGLAKAWVNDGGDIAFHLTPDATFELGLVADLGAPGLSGRATIRFDDPVRGAATSGRGGRSFSLGIADAVTVLAATAAAADVAATLIANAVDLPGHTAIRRGPASAEAPDSDLGDRLVVLDVGPLSDADIAAALKAGAATAERMRIGGLIHAAALTLHSEWRATENALKDPHRLTRRRPA
ncbi:hypothetical protein BAL199_15858 [alpha proteobacterium BAL199]|nr:hypothetical protein BAL199_15858 [alpha proteobacterium BAL199]